MFMQIIAQLQEKVILADVLVQLMKMSIKYDKGAIF